MFRTRYPDAPNLFSDVRRPYRPRLSTELRRTWLVSLIGVVLVLAGISTLFYNEKRVVTMTAALEEGSRKILVPETVDVVFEENNNKLVLASGRLNVEDSLDDATYGLSIRAVKLKKRVQMYQWHETADGVGVGVGVSGVPDAVHEGDHDSHNEATYSYAKEWFDSRVDSEAFRNPMGHHNPEDWPFNSSLTVNPRVKLGGFLLGDEVKKKFKEYTPVTSDDRPTNPDIKMHAGIYYHADDVWQHEVGDVRVHFSFAGKHGDLVTVIGKQSGREIRPYQTENGEELAFLHTGIKKPDEIFGHEHAQNMIYSWLYRLLGWFLMFIGYNCLSAILDIIVDDTPRIRRIFVLGVTSLPFSFALSTSLFTIGIGWVIFRPAAGLCVLFVALTPSFLAMHRIHQARELERRRRL